MANSEADILERVANWPVEAQAKLRQIAAEMETQLYRGVYVATPAELDGIDAGLAGIAKGNVVGLEEIERLFEKHRPK